MMEAGPNTDQPSTDGFREETSPTNIIALIVVPDKRKEFMSWMVTVQTADHAT